MTRVTGRRVLIRARAQEITLGAAAAGERTILLRARSGSEP